MPPVVAFIASVTTGLTSFGDAVVFHVVWSLFGAVGLLPPETAETLQKAVLYLSILALTNLIPMMYFIRNDIRLFAPWGAMEAVGGIPMTAVGALLLYSSDIGPLKLAVGVFFLFFSIGQMIASARSAGLARLAAHDSHGGNDKALAIPLTSTGTAQRRPTMDTLELERGLTHPSLLSYQGAGVVAAAAAAAARQPVRRWSVAGSKEASGVSVSPTGAAAAGSHTLGSESPSVATVGPPINFRSSDERQRGDIIRAKAAPAVANGRAAAAFITRTPSPEECEEKQPMLGSNADGDGPRVKLQLACSSRSSPVAEVVAAVRLKKRAGSHYEGHGLLLDELPHPNMTGRGDANVAAGGVRAFAKSASYSAHSVAATDHSDDEIFDEVNADDEVPKAHSGGSSARLKHLPEPLDPALPRAMSVIDAEWVVSVGPMRIRVVPISSRVSLCTSSLVLLVTGVVSGLLGGMLGTTVSQSTSQLVIL